MAAAVGDLACSFALFFEVDNEIAPGRRQQCAFHCDWSDLVLIRAAREVLMGAQYPDDATRRLLYASWLRAFADSGWLLGFDQLMLNCVAATPSLTNPGKPLFADLFRVDCPVGRCQPRGLKVLNAAKLPAMFACKVKNVEPLPENSAFFRFMADLIRKGSTNREALDEAGMIIGFCSLALAIVAAKPAKNVQHFFETQMRSALTVAVPTTFDGDIPWPGGRFMPELTRSAHSAHGVIKPYIVLLAVGQYIYHVKEMEAARSADVNFLMEAFLKPAKFGHLEIVELFSDVRDQTGLDTTQLCQILAEDSSVSESSKRVSEFFACAGRSSHLSLPWCRAASSCFCPELALNKNIDYALRLMAFLAPDPGDRVWKKQEFAAAGESRIREARLWAREFKRALRKGKYGDLPNWNP
ncbi:uncharacterized protein LOC144104743 [Amblyomma americanum]